MPNQYSDNFEINMAKKYGKSANEVLQDFYEKGISYIEASDMTGYKVWTVKRWCRRYGISLAKKDYKHAAGQCDVLAKIHESKVNKYNIFSRKWVVYH
ncbi:hypothetical protein [Facilibium subflavum]|uniref:hypothetical protein n=1 Tax=Facilibium subflavum TaxID=2219058 RepID=UPI000E658DE9|nr:hypothetical protein [Facilibium subflavum]